MIKNIGFGICGSFCTFDKILVEIEKIVQKGYNVIPILSNSVLDNDTRFFKSCDFVEKITKLTGNKPITDIVAAEPLGPKNLIDIMVISPCTGNTLAKLANGISDNAVTMVAKSLMRNFKPVVIGFSSNDGLGLNLKNLATLINTKGIYFVPFGQDDPTHKPKSLIADYSKILETIEFAEQQIQIQPILLKGE